MASSWNTRIIDEFHAKHGKGIGRFGDRLLLLTTHGAKSGKAHTVPLAFHRDGDRYVIVASMGGAPKNPVWYYNLKAHPDAVVIQDGPEPFDAALREVSGSERDEWWERAVAAYPPYAEYQERTDRTIPVFVAGRRA